MLIAIKSLIILIATLHTYFLYLEMFAWKTRGPVVFKGLPLESFETTKVMAANQGLYNGFLAAGLVWSLLIKDLVWSENVGTIHRMAKGLQVTCYTKNKPGPGLKSSLTIVFKWNILLSQLKNFGFAKVASISRQLVIARVAE